jgi:hypothetical protein
MGARRDVNDHDSFDPASASVTDSTARFDPFWSNSPENVDKRQVDGSVHFLILRIRTVSAAQHQLGEFFFSPRTFIAARQISRVTKAQALQKYPT